MEGDMQRRLYITDWYAIFLCLWSVPTGLAVAFWFGIGPIGPAADPSPVSWLGRYWPVMAWLVVPFVFAPFGLRRASSQ